MPKYEIMLVVDGELNESDARSAVADLVSLFNNDQSKNFQEKITWNDQLAYEIRKRKTAHRFLLNFESNDQAAIKEFNRLVTINKAVLRHLLINLEKDYAYKSLVNPKKIKTSEFRQKKFQEYLEKKQRELEAAEAAVVINAGVVEAKMRKVRDYKGLDTNATTSHALKEEAKRENFSSEE